jgi:hypothetical protein
VSNHASTRVYSNSIDSLHINTVPFLYFTTRHFYINIARSFDVSAVDKFVIFTHFTLHTL